ncbi:IS3 family transposase [Alteribacillus sp. HJP-4]
MCTEGKLKVNENIEKYNYDRYQWGLIEMTPAKYRSHLLSVEKPHLLN